MTTDPPLVQVRDFTQRSRRAMQLDVSPDGPATSVWLALVVLGIHAVGLATIVRLTRQPAWVGAFLLLLVLPAAITWKRRRSRPLLETLSPLLLAYGVALLRLIIGAAVRPDPRAMPVPEPWGTLLDLNVAMLLGSAWALLTQIDAAGRTIGRSVPWRRALGTVVLGITLAWAGLAYTSTRTHGVTASDPFAYVQMAVDFAEHGTPQHAVSLTTVASDLEVSPLALVPVGYGRPDPVSYLSSSVWPPGYSVLLSLAYRFGGENGLYWLTPVLGVGALLATWWLALEVLRAEAAWRRHLSAGLAVLVLATSFEQVDRVLVPMADIPAQLFTVLAVLFALRARRTRPEWHGILSGACLGLAFDIRYTQILLVAGLLITWLRPGVGGVPLRGLCCSAIAAWLPVLPLFWYHAVAFGSPLSVESAELQLFAPENIPDALAGIVGEFLRSNEFLFLLPFVGLGAVHLWRMARWTFTILAAWVVVLLAFHLPYAAVRLRDVLSVFPVIALLVGIGMSVLVGWADRCNPASLLRLSCAGLIVGAMWLRTVPTLAATGIGARYSGFGYLLPEQRTAFDTLADLTPPGGVIASTLNSGPIALYSGREAVRPAEWTSSEWLRFVTHVMDANGRLFIMDDGVELARPLDDVRGVYRLQPCASLFLPYFSADAGSVNALVELYEVVPSPQGARADCGTA